MDAHARARAAMQRAGGIAALYIAVAYLAAIPYFVFLVNYPGVVDPIQKVISLRDNYASMYWMHVVSFEFVALALIVVTLAIHQRLKEYAPSTAQFATVVGLIRAGLLLASVMVFNYGMGVVVRLYATAPDQAVAAWQVIEPVASALGGSGGEVLGGVWFLLLNATALSAKVFPRALNWLGVVIGAAGILSVVPALSGLEAAFGLLQIVWFLWLGIVMVRALDRRPETE
ncbi:MAG: DUF4386 family protein [Actinomycetota bacterium]|nr:DUF4386 family protein [Actinomycetota bacterium]MDP3630667.1 DUF4386 family protein [Actinomycetota bacterium]